MSYCRFSTNGFQCDVYVYASAEGFTTHVASNRRPCPILYDEPDLFHDPDNPLQPIGLTRDGTMHTSETAGECADLLEDLKAEGYSVPENVIVALREEAAEGVQ